jgi:hypothetical protein
LVDTHGADNTSSSTFTVAVVDTTATEVIVPAHDLPFLPMPLDECIAGIGDTPGHHRVRPTRIAVEHDVPDDTCRRSGGVLAHPDEPRYCARLHCLRLTVLTERRRTWRRSGCGSTT